MYFFLSHLILTIEGRSRKFLGRPLCTLAIKVRRLGRVFLYFIVLDNNVNVDLTSLTVTHVQHRHYRRIRDGRPRSRRLYIQHRPYRDNNTEPPVRVFRVVSARKDGAHSHTTTAFVRHRRLSPRVSFETFSRRHARRPGVHKCRKRVTIVRIKRPLKSGAQYVIDTVGTPSKCSRCRCVKHRTFACYTIIVRPCVLYVQPCTSDRQTEPATITIIGDL